MSKRYIGLDWGTSSLRAYLFSHEGQVLGQRESAWGIMNLPALPQATADADRHAPFRHALHSLVGDWLGEPGTAPDIVACGMVGSAQGWCDVPYQPLPISTRALAGAMAMVDAGQGVTVAIAPGLIEPGALPNVLRGEETQIAGVPALLAQSGESLQGRWLLGLPGTHSKWVRVHDGEIQHFDTFMTGEVYAVLVQHSILGRTMQLSVAGAARDGVSEAFMTGVRNAGSEAGRAGVLSTVFSSRTLGLTGQLSGAEQHDYLSGLLIGHEIIGLLDRLPAVWRESSIALVGRPGLCQRYQVALQHFGQGARLLSEDAGVHGLWALIRHRHPEWAGMASGSASAG